MLIRNQVNIDIPFYSQQVSQKTYRQDGFDSFDEALSWEKRGCGIASVRMIIDGFQNEIGQKHCGSHGEMIHVGLKLNAYKENIGWIHQGLCNLAANFDIQGQAFRGKTVLDLQQEIEKGNPCIASVTPRFAGGQMNEEGEVYKTGGHLIVVMGTVTEGEELKAFIVNHPSCFENCNWEKFEVDVDRFAASFSGNFITFWKNEKYNDSGERPC